MDKFNKRAINISMGIQTVFQPPMNLYIVGIENFGTLLCHIPRHVLNDLLQHQRQKRGLHDHCHHFILLNICTAFQEHFHVFFSSILFRKKGVGLAGFLIIFMYICIYIYIYIYSFPF